MDEQALLQEKSVDHKVVIGLVCGRLAFFMHRVDLWSKSDLRFCT